jgi:hypothetical protein
MSARRGRPLVAAAALGLGLALSLALAELGLRALGERPWVELPMKPGEPVMYEPDPVLGWQARPGAYTYPVLGLPIRQTILADGSRATGPRAAAPEARVVVLGDSFAQGWGLDDEVSLPWRMQEARPRLAVLNFATSGYGTYQSLLRLERLFDQGPAPDLVIYALTELQEERNVANPRWLHDLQRVSRRGTVAVPYATLGPGGALVRHPPASYPAWPLRTRLALVAFGQREFEERRGAGRLEQRHAVTGKLVLAMDALCRERGASLLVAVLWAPQTRAFYVRELGRAGVAVADCALDLTPELSIPGDGHPNAAATARWRDCLLPAIDGALAEPAGAS